jgi:hypothetical protein
MRRILAPILALALAWAPIAQAANLTPDQLTQAITANNTDLMVIYPTGGPLKSIQWTVLKTLMVAAVGGVYLQINNNLNDLQSPSSARTNLGLGTAALANTGTSGGTVPLLSGVNTWSGAQSWVAGSTTVAPFLFQSGSLLTAPAAGAVEWDGSNEYVTKTSGPTRETLGYADGSNFSVSAVSTALSGQTSGTLAAGNDSRFVGPTQNGQCSYVPVLSDGGKQLYCNTAGTHTLTLPANSSVAFQVGTKIDVVNDCSAGVMTIAITTDTLVFFTAGTTGSRTLVPCGEATLTKVNTTRWIIVGVGVN